MKVSLVLLASALSSAAAFLTPSAPHSLSSFTPNGRAALSPSAPQPLSPSALPLSRSAQMPSMALSSPAPQLKKSSKAKAVVGLIFGMMVGFKQPAMASGGAAVMEKPAATETAAEETMTPREVAIAEVEKAAAEGWRKKTCKEILEVKATFSTMREAIKVNTNQHFDVPALRVVFNKYDSDGGGSIDAAELQACLRDSIGAEVSVEDCEKFILVVDADGDRNIDFEEFCSITRAAIRWNEEHPLGEQLTSFINVWVLPLVFLYIPNIAVFPWYIFFDRRKEARKYRKSWMSRS